MKSVGNIERLRQVIDEMTDVREISVVQDVHFFGGAMMVRFAPRVARKHKKELVLLLNLVFPANGGGLRSGMTSEYFNEILGEMFLAVQVIAAGCLLGLWQVAESPSLVISDLETRDQKQTLPARLMITAVRLW